jgi:hypothetical protein
MHLEERKMFRTYHKMIPGDIKKNNIANKINREICVSVTNTEQHVQGDSKLCKNHAKP